MPPELKDYDWEANEPEELEPLTLSHEYNEVSTARQAGLNPGEFRLLPYDEQAELTAFFYVKSRIESFHANNQRQAAEVRHREAQRKADAARHTRM